MEALGGRLGRHNLNFEADCRLGFERPWRCGKNALRCSREGRTAIAGSVGVVGRQCADTALAGAAAEPSDIRGEGQQSAAASAPGDDCGADWSATACPFKHLGRAGVWSGTHWGVVLPVLKALRLIRDGSWTPAAETVLWRKRPVASWHEGRGSKGAHGFCKRSQRHRRPCQRRCGTISACFCGSRRKMWRKAKGAVGEARLRWGPKA